MSISQSVNQSISQDYKSISPLLVSNSYIIKDEVVNLILTTSSNSTIINGISYTIIYPNTILYKALKIPHGGLFEYDDPKNTFAFDNLWFSTFEIATKYSNSYFGKKQGYKVVRFKIIKKLLLFNLPDFENLQQLSNKCLSYKNYLTVITNNISNNTEYNVYIRELLAIFNRKYQILLMATGYSISYKDQLDFLLKYGNVITNDPTYDPKVEIDKRKITQDDKFIDKNNNSIIYKNNKTTFGPGILDLNRISFTTNLDDLMSDLITETINCDIFHQNFHRYFT